MGYQGTYLRFRRLVLTLRASATAAPPILPIPVLCRLQKSEKVFDESY